MKNILTATALCLFLTLSLYAQTGSGDGSGTKAGAADSSATKTRRKAFRPTKTQITEAQTRLGADGTYEGPADGRYNNDFRAALRKYQETNGLERTGRLDEATLGKMGIGLTDRQKGLEPTDEGPKRVVFRPTREQVAEAQRKLSAAGLYQGPADGRYNKELRTAIREFQSANGLKRKGSLNRATLEKMAITLTEDQERIPVRPDDLAPADKGDRPRRAIFRATRAQIEEVQGMLRSKGLYKGEDTGRLNDETRAAIRQWQEQNGVPVTGTLNRVTLEAMGVTLTDRQKEM